MRESVGNGERSVRVRWMRAASMVLLGTLALAAACSRNMKEGDEPAEPIPTTRLKVENQAYLDMTIYVYRSSQRVRLGVANGSSTTRMVIPANLIFGGSTALRFQADPIGASRQPVSQEISVSPGDEVILIIPP